MHCGYQVLHSIPAWRGGQADFMPQAPGQVVQYVSAHDNYTLWDKLSVSCPEASEEKKKAMNELKDEISGIAVDIASKVVEREIDEKDHEELISEFIKGVGEAS